MTTATYRLPIGGTHRFLLSTLTGSIEGATCVAGVRKFASGARAIDVTATMDAEFAIEDFAGDEERQAGFWLVADGSFYQTIVPALYMADARVTKDGEKTVTNSWSIEFYEPASRPIT